jgi:hypothetical protein
MINLLDIFVYLLNQQLIKNVCFLARKFSFFWGGQFSSARDGSLGKLFQLLGSTKN